MFRKLVKCISILTLAFSAYCNADVKLPRLISDNMVLQRDTEITLWGWAEPNEKVTVHFDGQLVGSVQSDAKRWSIKLKPQPAGTKHLIQITANNTITITINNVAFGEVWLASGQSNMVLPMERVKERYPRDIAEAHYPDIRHFTVPTVYNFRSAQADYPIVQWQELSPESVMKFSATAFFFARDLYETYHVPIGVINASVGGSPVEAWMSEKALIGFPKPYAEAKLFQNDSHIKAIQDADKALSDNWYTDINNRDAGLSEKWFKAEFDDKNWQPFTLPGFWEDQKVAPMNGVVWFRKTIDVPKSMAGKRAKLMMGAVVDADTIYVNGIEVGNTTYQYPPRRYTVPKGVLVAGKNVIAIRVINNRGKGGFVADKPYWLGKPNAHINLTGIWQFKVSVLADELPNQNFIQYKPTGLFNAMIAPALDYKIKGVIWYQGESNTGNPSNYQALFSNMIKDWRNHFNQQSLPFLYVQLANFMEASDHSKQSNWAELREQQRLTLNLPNTAMAVIIDSGEWNDIHPLNKYAPGHRLALAAQNIAYHNKKTVYSGPQITTIEEKHGALFLNFTHTGGGLVAKNGDLQGFAIAAKDGKFVWAKAKIIGQQIKVWHNSVPAPVKVRYAWADNPANANLYNKEGLPASPFQANLTLTQ